MIFKKIVSTLSVITIALGTMTFMPGDEVKASTVPVSDLYADFSEVSFVCKYGHPVRVYVDGTSIGYESDCAHDFSFSLKDENYRPVFTETSDGSAEFEVADEIDEDGYYYIDLIFEAEGIEYRQYDLYVTKKANGNVCFLKSLAYDFNVERCSELWTDEQSLLECLQPQNDVECDDPYVINYANSITAGMDNDWDKAFAIYSHIVNDFAYDYVQVEDRGLVYQDDALSLLRREIAICEGMGNTFVALCRAAGIPAAVSFGIGANAEDMMFDSDYETDEGPNHAWACVCLDGTWYHVDPTWDCMNAYEGDSYYGGEISESDCYYNFYLMPLEAFSMTHKICDADTIHGIEQTGSAGDSATYSISRDGTLTISGSGVLELPYGCNGFSKVEFAENSNITSIGEQCFIDCDIITSIVLPDTVTRIEDYAFYTCEDLEYVILPEGLTYIGEQAFDMCDELAYVYVPDSVTEIGRWAFDDASRLILSVPDRFVDVDENYDISPYMIIYRERE